MPRIGIIKKIFLKGNSVIINLKDDLILIPDKLIKIPARSEFIVCITLDAVKNKVLLLKNQEDNNV